MNAEKVKAGSLQLNKIESLNKTIEMCDQVAKGTGFVTDLPIPVLTLAFNTKPEEGQKPEESGSIVQLGSVDSDCCEHCKQYSADVWAEIQAAFARIRVKAAADLQREQRIFDEL